jgi:hypothetical protein
MGDFLAIQDGETVDGYSQTGINETRKNWYCCGAWCGINVMCGTGLRSVRVLAETGAAETIGITFRFTGRSHTGTVGS